MSATLLYCIAAVLLLLFAVGHTVGFMGFKPASPEGLAVRDAMNSVRFEFKGASHSYGGFYTGFGLTVTAYLVFSAFLAWHLLRSQPGVLLPGAGLVLRTRLHLPGLGGLVASRCRGLRYASACAPIQPQEAGP